jgi:ring-1,2-phenylacetyl-CoA epoxidase subunit PaaB
MTDQWPRYEVFKQDRLDGPFRNVGSVHAPDAELALMNARDVFARRPSCVALWVVPDTAIMRRTAEELLGEKGSREAGATEDSIQYAVFSKESQRQAMTYVDYVGEVTARSPEEAIREASETFGAGSGLVWWSCPARAIVASDPDDLPGLEAATGKLFRMPNQYRTVFTMQKIRRGEEGEA